MQMCLLVKTDDVKMFGFGQVLEPFLKDVAELEVTGVYIESLGRFLKGSIAYVVGDNFAANAIGGFVESFSPNVKHYCRYCVTSSSDIAAGTIPAYSFEMRSRDNYAQHVVQLENPGMTVCCGLKSDSPLHKHVQYFHVVDGLPPDACHDLLEGIVPVEISLCLSYFVDHGFISLSFLNTRIKCFPYKDADKVNCPQPVADNFKSKRSIGGNMAENLTLIRLLPLLIGARILKGDPAWELLMELKDIVDLVLSPKLTDEALDVLQVKIGDHRQMVWSVFPKFTPTAKLHFLDHYPALIRKFGPAIDVWTMRFEGKHCYLKHVVKRAHNMKNILNTVATRHQFLQSYHLQSNYFKDGIDFSADTDIPVACLPTDVQQQVNDMLGSSGASVGTAKNVAVKGLTYAVGMFVSYGSAGGLPGFGKIKNILLINSLLYLLLHLGDCYFHEHFRAYEFRSTDVHQIVSVSDLNDYHPLPGYNNYCTVAGDRILIVPKCFFVT